VPRALKIWVRVKSETGEYRLKRKVQPDGEHILVRKISKKDKNGVKFEIGERGIYPVRKAFGGIALACDWFYGASKAVQYDFKDQKLYPAILDLATQKEWATADVIRNYLEGGKTPTPIIFYAILMIGIIGLGMMFFIGHGLHIF
jgi:hypothetical protein